MIDIKTVNNIIFYLGLPGACTDVEDEGLLLLVRRRERERPGRPAGQHDGAGHDSRGGAGLGWLGEIE
jgi:hypothetical protein